MVQGAGLGDLTASICTILVQTVAMKSTKQVRRSVTLPSRLAEQVERIARKKHLSENRVLVEQGLEAQKGKERLFSHWPERFRAASDPEEVRQLSDAMGRFIFGE